MRILIPLVAGTLVSTQAWAAPKALSCTVVEKNESTANFQATKETETKDVTLTLVIDDAKKSVDLYKPDSAALTPVCQEPDCRLDYGAKQIQYLVIGKEKGVLAMRSLLIDRVSGEYKSMATRFRMDIGSDWKFERKGICKAAPMPTMAAPNAKF